MDQVTQPKSNKPIIGLLLSLSSIFFCCLSFMISPQNYEELPFSEPLWIFSQILLCLAGLVPFIGTILGILSLRKGEANRRRRGRSSSGLCRRLACRRRGRDERESCRSGPGR